MNQKEKALNERKNWYKYHIPDMTNLQRVKKNAIFISTANSIEHETEKLKICYELKSKKHKFITEAELNRKKGDDQIRRDVVDITTGDVYEIETRQSAIDLKKKTQVKAFDYEKVIWKKITAKV